MNIELTNGAAEKAKSLLDRQTVSIKPPNLVVASFELAGTTPYMQHRFWKKAEMMATQSLGSTAKKGKKRDPRDFDRDYHEAMYLSAEGWHGLPAPAFRAALISACRLVGFKMTLAKLSVFVLHDGIDARDGTPLVRITGTPEKSEMMVRNADGSVDIRVRPLWSVWGLNLRLRYDADQFTLSDVANLLERAGSQVGIGEGRPDSKRSAGLGFGTFTIVKREMS